MDEESLIDQIIGEGLGRLDRQERDINARLVAIYDQAAKRVERDLAALTRQIEEARAAGEDVNPDWLRRQDRYLRLLRNIDAAYADAAEKAAGVVSVGQHAGATEGIRVANDLTVATLGPGDVGAGFNSANVPTEAVNRWVSATEQGSPVRDVLDRYGPAAAQQIEQAFAEGMAQGFNPRKVAREARRRIGGKASQRQLELLTRTEMMRAYRGAQVDQYQRNPRLAKVRWVSARDARTCLFCLSMHGQEFPIDQKPTTHHPLCRCNFAPVPTKRYAAVAARLQTGDDWLRSQPDHVQMQKLGGNRQAWQAWRDGKLKLSDFTTIRASKNGKWGPTGGVISGRAALKKAGIPIDRSRGEPLRSEVIETHPLNAGARRRPGGIWNEADLPVTSWEASEHRVVMPTSLQAAWGFDQPVLRWSRAKRDTTLRSHEADAFQIENIQDMLALVTKAGPDPREGRVESLAFFEHGDRLYRVVVGPDKTGSLNVVSIYGTNRPSERKRWQRDMASPGMRDVDPGGGK